MHKPSLPPPATSFTYLQPHEDDVPEPIEEYNNDFFLFSRDCCRCLTDMVVYFMVVFATFVIPAAYLAMFIIPMKIDTSSSLCVTTLNGTCESFYAQTPGQYVVYFSSFQSEDLCPLSMQCVVDDAVSIFFRDNLSAAILHNETASGGGSLPPSSTYNDLMIAAPNASDYTISPPVSGFLGGGASLMTHYWPFCAKYPGGVVPQTLSWMLFQGALNALITILINLLETTWCFGALIDCCTGCCACCWAPCCGKKKKGEDHDDDDDDGRASKYHKHEMGRVPGGGSDHDDGDMMNNIQKSGKKSADEQRLMSSSQSDEEGGGGGKSIYSTKKEESRIERVADLESKSFTRRGFEVTTGCVIICFCQLITGAAGGIYNAVSEASTLDAGAPDLEHSAWDVYSSIAVQFANNSVLGSFVTFGCLYFCQVSAQDYDLLDAMIYEVIQNCIPCCFLWQFYCMTIGVAKQYVWDCVAPTYHYFSLFIKCRLKKDAKGIPKIAGYFLTLQFLLTVPVWCTHIWPGLFVFLPIVLIIIGGFLMVALGSVIWASILTACLRIKGTYRLPKTGKLRPIYRTGCCGLAAFSFCRLALTYFMYLVVGVFAWSMGANLAQMCYTDPIFVHDIQAYVRAIFVDIGKRSQSCYMMPWFMGMFSHQATQAAGLI